MLRPKGARWPLARRHGNGGRDPRGADQQVRRARAARQQGRGDSGNGHDRYRHRQLHDRRADRRRNDGRTRSTRWSPSSAIPRFPETPGSGGQQGAPFGPPPGLRGVRQVARSCRAKTRLQLGGCRIRRRGGAVRRPRAAARRRPPQSGDILVEDFMEYGDLSKRFAQQTFGAHFVEAGVDFFTGEIRVRRMLAVCAAGRILNPKTARSQVTAA